MSYLYSEKDRNKIERARQDEKIMGAYGISYCLIEDAQYPSVMRELKGMPPFLYYKGNIESTEKCCSYWKQKNVRRGYKTGLFNRYSCS